MLDKEEQLSHFFLELKNLGDPTVFKHYLEEMKCEFLVRKRTTVIDGTCELIPEPRKNIWLRISGNYALTLAW